MLSGNVLQFSEEHPGPSRSQPVAPPPETRGMFVPQAAGSRPRAAILLSFILAFTLDLPISHYLEIPLDPISLTEALPLFVCTVGFDTPLHLADAVPNHPSLVISRYSDPRTHSVFLQLKAPQYKLALARIDALLTEFNRLDDKMILTEVLLPLGHPFRSLSIHNLAASLRDRFTQQGIVSDLDESIELNRAALLLHPPGHPLRSQSLNNLVMCLRDKFTQLGVPSDLHESIELNRAALLLLPPGPFDRTWPSDFPVMCQTCNQSHVPPISPHRTSKFSQQKSPHWEVNGERASRVAGALSDLKAENVLPRRYESATVYQEKLKKIYHTKLEQLTTLTNCLNALARTLGSHFFHQDILTPAVAASEELDSPTAIKDVMPERFSKLEKKLVRGKGEVLKRLNQLGEVFTQIDWLYSELGIDPPPPTTTTPVATSSSTLAVPRYSLPRSSSASSTRLNSSADPFASSTIGPLTPTPSSIGKSDNHMLCPSSSPPQPPTALPEVPEFPNEREYLFTEGLKQENSPIYPLTSKLPIFKRFRASLSELISRLVLSAADVGALYTSDMVTTLQTWVVAMSSSQIRAFRHTATAVALEVETALCQVAAAVEKEAEIVGRQREGERKRRAANKAQNVMEKDLDGKAAEVRKRRAALAEYLKEIVDGVFVHRYRDLDPHIRAECVRAMGHWFTHYPAHFLDASYLRYVGWVLSDSATPVRLEAVRALSAVYAQAEYISGLMNFTARFKPRLLEMAARDTELAVRTAVLGVLGAVDQHGLLEDEEREQMCQLVFDGEVRVRKAVAGFVGGLWNELVEERLAGRKVGEKGKERAGAKALAMLLVRWDRERVEEEDGSQDGSQRGVTMSTEIKGRTALAVEALWDDVDSASGWEGLLEMLLLDHSAGGGDEDLDAADDSIAASAKNTVDEAWRLTETEESVLLEVLIASLRRAKALAGTAKKGEDETLLSDLTRALIKGLPRLFIKYQTDANRIANVLLIPPLMNIELYLEMRMMTAYANLWDDITKQFLSHSAQTVLASAVSCITHLLSCPSLSNTNSTKILELEDELAAQLRDAVGGREEIEVAGFNEDEVLALGAVCARVCALIGTRDLCGWMEESEGGKQSCVWDIIAALVERGRLGYREERMIEQGLQVLGLHIMWKTRSLPDAKEATPEDEKYMETLREQRDSLLEKLVEYAVGTQSNTAEAVKRAAFQNLMTLHILFCAEQTTTPDGRVLPTAALPLELDDEVQYRCAGFIQAAIEQYAELLEEGHPSGEEEVSESGESSGEENVPAKGKKGKTKAKSPVIKEQPLTRIRLEQEYVFMGTISTFLRAIRAGAVHVRHSAVLLAHYGRLGPAFDLCTKVIIDALREEGMYRENGDLVVDVVTQALKESFTLVLDSIVRGEDHVVALAKQLGQSFMIRGAQLSIVKKLDSQHIVQTHTNLLTWIVKRIGTYEAAKNKKARKTAILFFRVLQPLLAAVDSRDALKIKAHMDQVLAQTKIEVPPSSKIWEPQRAYEKKLSSIMAKGKGGAKGRKAKGAKSAAIITSDESESEPEPRPAEEEPPAPKPRPKPRPLRRQRSPTSSLSELESSDLEAGVQERIKETKENPEAEPDVQAEHEQDQATPRNRPRPQATYGRSPTKTPSVPPVPNGITSPSTRKRQRTDGDDEDAGEKSGVEAIEANGDTDTPGHNAPREESPTNQILFRRKRARY